MSETTMVSTRLPPIDTGTAKKRRNTTSTSAKITRWRNDGTAGA